MDVLAEDTTRRVGEVNLLEYAGGATFAVVPAEAATLYAVITDGDDFARQNVAHVLGVDHVECFGFRSNDRGTVGELTQAQGSKTQWITYRHHPVRKKQKQ